MYRKIFTLLILAPAFALVGCLSEDDSNTDAPSESGMVPGNISVNCTTATSPACDVASDGLFVSLVWSSETCDVFQGDNLSATNDQTATCAAGECDAENSGDWLEPDTDEVLTLIPTTATTAAAWLNFTDGGAGDGDGPGSGDVFCCLEGDGTDAVLDDSACFAIP